MVANCGAQSGPVVGAGSASRVLFLGCTYAGHATRFSELQRHVHDDPRIQPVFRRLTGWVDGGLYERMPLVPRGFSGRVRALHEATAITMFPRPDVIWSAAGDIIAPYVWYQAGSLARPLIYDLDWTNVQQEEMAKTYFDRQPRRGWRRQLLLWRERLVWRRVTLFTPWSNWVADSLRRQGIDGDRIRVLPPGVDLDRWHSTAKRNNVPERRLRLLFVGGDFRRKGGDLMLEVFRSRLADHCELDVVTRDPVEAPTSVRVHRAEVDSPLLRELYARADLFVLPTRADCFGIAFVEAMAAGLPVVAGDVGGVRDIVDHGKTGWLIPATGRDLAMALERALSQRDRLPAMGEQARRVAEQRFDGRRNDETLVQLILSEAERFAARTK